MRRFVISGVLVLSILFCVGSLAQAAWKVAIFDYDDRLHDADTVAKYLEKTLREQEPRVEIDQYSGEGDEQKAVEMIKGLDRAGYDLIITITSDALILAQHFLTQTPTLYTNANNPLFLGFSTLDAPGDNISGASYYVPIMDQLQFFKGIQPELGHLGFLFDEENRSRQAEVGETRNSCNLLDLDYSIGLITISQELATRVEELIEKGVDAIVVTSSETIYNNIQLFKQRCERAGIPIYAYGRKAVENGAVAALASDYYLMAEQLIVPMALRVLREGVSPGTMPAAFLDANLMFLNLTEAEKLGISIPEDIVQQAAEIY